MGGGQHQYKLVLLVLLPFFNRFSAMGVVAAVATPKRLTACATVQRNGVREQGLRAAIVATATVQRGHRAGGLRTPQGVLKRNPWHYII